MVKFADLALPGIVGQYGLLKELEVWVCLRPVFVGSRTVLILLCSASPKALGYGSCE